MKILIYIFLFRIIGCVQSEKKVDGALVENASLKMDTAAHKDAQNTNEVIYENVDSLNLEKEEYNQIIKENPEFNSNEIAPPDQTYYRRKNKQGFNSEAGEDNYYALYAFFLMKKNGEGEYAERRKKLISLYSNLNYLFQRFNNGGTFFGHQQKRIIGYAEYSVYLYKENKDVVQLNYDISKQKSLYIQSLHELIKDQDQINSGSNGPGKIKLIKQLNTMVDKIEKDITDHFYLRNAQGFHYAYYDYW